MFGKTAHVYDLIYEGAGKDYAAESVVVRDLIETRNPSARQLLDVAGVDIDPAMLAEARRKLPDIPLVQADMRTFQLHRRFDAVVCLFSSIGYLLSVDELQAAVERMTEHLAPGGVLVVDGWIRPDEWIEPGTVQAETGHGAGIAVARVTRSRREGKKTYLEMHHLVGSVDGIEYLVDHHELTLFEPQEYEDAFLRAGLTVDRLDSPMPGRDRYVAVAD